MALMVLAHLNHKDQAGNLLCEDLWIWIFEHKLDKDILILDFGGFPDYSEI